MLAPSLRAPDPIFYDAGSGVGHYEFYTRGSSGRRKPENLEDEVWGPGGREIVHVLAGRDVIDPISHLAGGVAHCPLSNARLASGIAPILEMLAADVSVGLGVDGVEHAGIADPVAALGLGSTPPVALLLVGGEVVVRDAQLLHVDEVQIAHQVTQAANELASRV